MKRPSRIARAPIAVAFMVVTWPAGSHALGLSPAHSTAQASTPTTNQRDESPEPPAPGWTGYRFVLAYNLGLGSAIGEAGATAAFWPTSFTGTEVGVGLGNTGTQYSLVQKFAVGSPPRATRFVFGAGVAYATGSQHTTGSIVWLNLDLAGLEVRTRRHFVFFLAGGLTAGLTGGKFDGTIGPSESDCSPYPSCLQRSKAAGYVAPQLRMGLVGGWF
jgi:hypothetical protein